MNQDERKIRDLIYQILGKPEIEYKIDRGSRNIFEAFECLWIASKDFYFAAELEDPINDKEFLHTMYSLLQQRKIDFLKLWEVATNLGIADRTNNKILLAEIMPRLTRMRERV